MGIFKRLQDIVSANIGEMIEDMEDPEPMLKQAIREMDTAIAEAKKETAQAMANEKLVKKNLADNQQQARDWQTRAEKAIQGGDEPGARKALVRKQECDKVIAAIEDQSAAATDASQTLRRQLEAMQAKLAEAKRRLGTLAARQKAAEVRNKAAQRAANVSTENDAFSKFDRISEKISKSEAEAEALRELEKSMRPSVEPELAESVHSDVEDELAALKKKLGK